MIIKLRCTVDPSLAIVFYIDGACGPEVARVNGVMLASQQLTPTGKRVWRLAVKGQPRAPRDVVAIYDAIPFDVTTDPTAAATEDA